MLIGASGARADVSNVPAGETAGYQLVYDINLPNSASFGGAAVPYNVDNRSAINSSWDRVAYYMELQDSSNNTTWAYASMDPFGAGLQRIGIPASYANGGTPKIQTFVNNLHVFSNSGAVTTGTFASTGNLEFWGANYDKPNATVPNASNSAFDFGDTLTGPNNGYGSFQIHNSNTGAGQGQTIIAYNHFNNSGGATSDIGIGNRPGTADTDWTFASNADQYTVKRLQVLVHTAGNPAFTVPSTKTPIANGFQLLKAASLPGSSGQNDNGIPYQVDKPLTGTVAKIGYYLELHKKTDPAGQNQYVFVSMDAFTQDASKMGVPTKDTESFFQQNVTGVSVDSNVAGIVTGNIGTGNIEFWPSNYGGAKNASSPPNANDGTFDFGDSGGDLNVGYGSFQIHNPTAGQTILAYNNWGSGGGDTDLGIGNRPTADPDWTFAHNALGDYDIRNFEVLVTYVPEPTSLMSLAIGGAALLARRRRV